ncbi:1-(5-phosphoribosyl)-5-[(5-phosphoribosylamino)methylideneamino] imidazole-4-carboxamide isomerase [Caminicella sporogenes DSM 14501]|uniref:1-(5-phosphoribosyl)-5-[(5-phosphoribosylamino)methylideneamino] imidazole-4-carboxamide isomerase n=1 Tax=Caminicella sporogenes DSM 14501 TaxID=1121266 RepID=A0A1M6S4X0_9FIRM|nr:1-(5-phosphoribosyl)-5-[(5-phosphoribosylamino)methylideneamino]imidazole-4-carboxamide isomerase [Caminicella sporogenes]RKD27195.1 1-(5-phosphoribosyl)-5-[(5-phosphoribosylamino)methylideneamino]imidazole-4-carboxamide isomerase [Caminicella sporogenes]SHK39720.1 1-(5-phosphoribosyl)-5-[(5-phosphoribosylamino)methylideneamino] imidazole-4-carboxamide isomerase [Caminicella sporogenes DSM 14501]
MIIFPAIDIRNGRCVRLYQGKFNRETVYDDDPVLIAKRFEENKAKVLHVVDLDGAFTGEQKNIEIIKKIVRSINIPVQVGGGIRSIERAKQLMDLGVYRIVIGTCAVKENMFVENLVKRFGDRVVVSIDTKAGCVCVNGWVESSSFKSVEFAKLLEEKGIKTIVYTDISKDGTMIGPNFEEIKKLKENTSLNIIASGGIGRKEDIDKLKTFGVYGAIVGKALYEGKIKLEDFVKNISLKRGEYFADKEDNSLS